MEKSRLFPILLLVSVCSYFASSHAEHSKIEQINSLNQKKEALKLASTPVHTLQLATTLGESTLKDLYGEELKEIQKPFTISLKNDVWTLESSKQQSGMNIHIQICRTSGAILVVHN